MNWLKNLIISIGVGVFAIAIIARDRLIAAIPTYFLWNWLMPTIFDIKIITFLQAWGITFLTGILFKNLSSSKNPSSSKSSD